MNSEELEQSLRTEFEGYLKNILADMRQEVSQFQQKIDTELEKHKSQLDEVFQEFSTRIQTHRELDEGFKESVVEHLRLARDEGARITATAIAEAEELTKAEQKEIATVTAEPSVQLSDIRDAINDISSQNSQSAILKSLINHAAKFTPRGAFFVVKNQHFVGWRVFGKQENLEDGSITEIVFPISAATILGESVRSLAVVESIYGTYANDSDYLTQLDFGQPDTMFAVPLIARGRGVAAIYADAGDDNDKVNIEALETLVNVAGLTVELLAAAQSSNYTREPVRSSSAATETAVAETPQVAAVQEEVEETVSTPENSYQEATPSYGFYEEAKETADTYEEVEEVEAVEEKIEEFASNDSYSSAESNVQEIEVEESALTNSYSEITETSDDVYEVSDDFEPSETTKVEYTESVTVKTDDSETTVEETYSFSSETLSESESVEPDYATYDDDLIEEVQAQADEDDEIESVYEEPAAVAEEVKAIYEEIPAEEEVETVYQETSPVEEEKTEEITETIESDWNQPETEVKESYSFQTDSQADSEISDSNVETIDLEEDYSTRPSVSYAEFETNQDFNSSPVQFEESVEEETVATFETSSYEFSQPETEATPEVEEVSYSSNQDESEEVSYGSDQAETEEVLYGSNQEVQANEFSLDTLQSFEPVTAQETQTQTEEIQEETKVEEPSEVVAEPVAAPVVATAPVRTRFSERNVDLPIEVSEEERRLHNDARRFARLLVSEIKLYNEQKVKEGRDAHDLYERLREAIDRSREMYDKRVQPVVVDRFDYFHYEVVNTLAEGEESKLGNSYPGGTAA